MAHHVLVAVILASALCGEAAAEPAPPERRREVTAGVERLEAGDFEGALEALHKAVAALKQQRSDAAELALAYQYLGLAALGLSEEIRARSAFLDRMRSSPLPTAGAPAALSAGRPIARLQVVVRPWAEVAIDGVEIGLTPMGRVRVAPGTHSVRAIHPGFEPVERKVTVRDGEVAKVVIDLTTEGVRRQP